MICVILFDFFDVIHRDHQKAWLAANGFGRSGGFADASDLLDRGEIDFEAYLQRYAEHSQRDAETVRAEMAAFDELDTDVVTIINELRQRYKIGLISNAHSSELRPILDRYDLPKLFDKIFISSEVGLAKPDPALFKHVLATMGFQPHQAVFIDDNADNVAAASQLGIKGIVFSDVITLGQQLRIHGVA